MDSSMDNSDSCSSGPCPTLPQEEVPQEGVKSMMNTENEPQQNASLNRMKRRPFEGLFADFDVSPRKVSRKDNDKDDGRVVLTDIEILQKGREKLREYRRYLSKKLEAPKYDLQMEKRLRVKDELIASLMLRVAELEDISRSNDDTSISDNGSDVKLTSTQKFLSIISRLEKENETLRTQVSDMKSERSAKNIQKDSETLLSRWSGNVFQFKGKEYNLPSRDHQQLPHLKLKVVEQEKHIDLLKEEKDSLIRRFSEATANHVLEERILRQKVTNLETKLIDLEVECLNKEIKFTEHLANNPSLNMAQKQSNKEVLEKLGMKRGNKNEMIIVESKAPRHYNSESLQIVEDKLKNVISSYTLLKKHFQQFPKLIQTVMEDAKWKIQEAIRTTDEKNKELVGKYAHEIQLRKQYHNQLVELKGNIRVYCRVRPCLAEDGLMEPAVGFDPFDDGIIIVNNKGKFHRFQMEKVFDMNASQSQVFGEVSALVRSAIDGFNVCIFAYGQTGSGKTHTMEGVAHDPGVNQRALQLLYEETKTSSWQYSIETSLLEIYNESLRDLLNSDPNTNKLEVKMKSEGGFHVPGLVTVPVNSLSEVNKIIETGHQNRATASTNMNERSSRSHSLLCIQVTGVNVLTGNKTFGRLNLVDLAGSERVSRSQADGARLKEAQNINKSLSSLGDVINALKNKHAHVPYRNSKLTYLLQESLGGDSKTLMILQVAPGEENVTESICTLTFGQRVRSAELGAAKKKTEGTPTVPRPESANSPMSGTSLMRTPIPSKASPMPSKLGQRPKP